VTAGATLLLACAITLVHYTGAHMRVPLLPLFARAHVDTWGYGTGFAVAGGCTAVMAVGATVLAQRSASKRSRFAS